jgi:transposase
MLQPENPVVLSDAERQLFEQLVPQDHFLRRLLQVIDFERFRPLLAKAYCPDDGRPPLDPVLMLKLEILARHYRLSDRELMRQVQVNAAYRLFLGLGCRSPLPHHTSMTYFRDRMGAERMQEIFQAVLGQARELGLVRDRLRLKDATHILANIAVPSTIRLVSQMRAQLLTALEPFDAQHVAEETRRAEEIRQASADLPDQERLLRRVTHLRAIVTWADAVPSTEVFRAAPPASQETVRQALALAHKVLADRDDPQGGDPLLSVHDGDARRGKHGSFFNGYMLDVAMDPDSELITAVNVLPGNGDEGGDAACLIEQEEQAHGNDVEALSMDGAGYRGPVLRQLSDPDGLHLQVYAPPSQRLPLTVFAPEQFQLSEDGRTLRCPAGQTTARYQRNRHDTGWRFLFSKKQCDGCELRQQCLPDAAQATGRSVIKNEYEAEYQAAQVTAQTPEYAEVRRQHPAIERKLSELVVRHDLRRARYRGLLKVLWQSCLTALVVNFKRLVRLLASLGTPPRGMVRAELAIGG